MPSSAVYFPHDCHPDDWTMWYDVDKPTGYGDYETIRMIRLKTNPEMICQSPTHIQGRVVGSGLDARDSNQSVRLNPSVGLICKNYEQRCLNYEVRFCCSKGE